MGRTLPGRTRTLISSVPSLGSPLYSLDAWGGPGRRLSEKRGRVAPYFLVLFLVYFSERKGWDGGGEGSSPGHVMRGDEELEFQAGELDFVLFPFE